MIRHRTDLDFSFAKTYFRISIFSPHRPKRRRQIALQIFRALKEQFREIRSAALDDERCYGPLKNQPIYANLYQSLPLDAFLGRLVRLERQKVGLTQVELASCLGISERTLIRVERGQTKASDRLLIKLERALGIDLCRLIEERERSLSKPDKT